MLYSELHIKIPKKIFREEMELIAMYYDVVNQEPNFILYQFKKKENKIFTIGACNSLNKKINKLNKEDLSKRWNDHTGFQKIVVISVPTDILYNLAGEENFNLS